ncbi:hypothetical protein EDD18DRAFT_1329592 [Armillaria luteobubalina]|uniref:Uncharacterized protein n=1 Tax=Armillaria luteobubalina TaxID=153913 RepID=A0AA39TSD4_9AGAR|nr:hypothetical protein EDD18DRAFT_1329592 [Armillaria luteobubalina]
MMLMHTAKLAEPMMVLEEMGWVVVDVRMISVRDELAEGIDLTLNGSEIMETLIMTMADAPQVDYPLRLGSLAKSVEMELRLPLVPEFIPQGFAELAFVVVLLLVVVLVMLLAVIPIDDCPDGSHQTEKRHRKILKDHPISFTGCCKWQDTARGVRTVKARYRRRRDFDPGYLWLFGIIAVRFLSPHEPTGTETQAHAERFMLGKLTFVNDSTEIGIQTTMISTFTYIFLIPREMDGPATVHMEAKSVLNKNSCT